MARNGRARELIELRVSTNLLEQAGMGSRSRWKSALLMTTTKKVKAQKKKKKCQEEDCDPKARNRFRPGTGVP